MKVLQLNSIRIWMMMMCMLPVALTAQFFMDPHYRAKNAETASLYSVEITENNTILCFNLEGSAQTSVYLSSKTYIENSEGGNSLYIQKAEGLSYGVSNHIIGYSSEELLLDKQYNNVSESMNRVKLYFPKIEREVSSINFRSGKDGNFWHFFEINVASDIGVDKTVKSARKGKNGNCRYVEEPGFTASSGGGFHITKIELCDTATILHFKVYNSGTVYIPSKSCIRDSNGGENLYVTSAKGTKLDETIRRSQTQNGEMEYSLFFPPIKKTVKNIDFREVNEGGTWFVYELDVDVN